MFLKLSVPYSNNSIKRLRPINLTMHYLQNIYKPLLFLLMMDNENNKEVVKENKLTKRIRNNPWILSTLVLGFLVLIIVIGSFTGTLTGKTISEQDAGKYVLDFVKLSGYSDGAIINTTSAGNDLYQVAFSYNQGKTASLFISKDGKYLSYATIPLDELNNPSNTSSQTTSAKVPKSDKPTADFYVFAYCPYGSQMEKALIPVYNLLKTKADINIVFIGAMHGEFEHVESLRQLSILNIYGKDKLFAYISQFDTNAAIGNCNGDDTCLTPILNSIYSSLSIDKSKVDAYMANQAPALYAADEQKAQANGVTGSPTVIINGVESQVGRSPSLVQEAICSAFNSAPSECSTQLSSTSASAGFGSDSGSASSGTQCG